MESSEIIRHVRKMPAVLSLAASGALFIQIAGCSTAEPEQRHSMGTAPGTAVETKVPVMFRTYVAYPDTKAGENTVENVVVSVYSDGALVENIGPGNGEDRELELALGRTYTYYASANIARDVIPETESGIKEERTAVKTSEPSGGFPMTAYGSFTVSGENTTVDIMLERLYSKIRFSVDKTDVPDLEIQSVTIRQAATSVAMFSESKAVSTAGGDSAGQTEITSLNSGAEIELYLPENCQGVLLPGNSDSWAKVPDNIPGKSGLCSYLEVSGEFSGERELKGKITYRFYLGQDATSDFNIIRNTENSVTLIPSREAITRPSWQVDGGNVYAEVPVLMMGDGQVLYKTKTERRIIFTKGNIDWEKAVRGDGKYVAIGNEPAGGGYIGYSGDGLAWETAGYIGRFTDITYGNGVFVAVSTFGTYVSSGGKSWSRVNPGATLKLVTFGNGKFIGISDNNMVYSSEDGMAWTSGNTSVVQPTLIGSGNAEFVSISGSGNVMKSVDGRIWTFGKYTFDPSPSGSFQDLVYGNGKYVLATIGETYWSDDALTWQRTDMATVNRSSFSLDYKDGVFVCGYTLTEPGVRVGCGYATSIDGMHWTEVVTDTQMVLPGTICIMN